MSAKGRVIGEEGRGFAREGTREEDASTQETGVGDLADAYGGAPVTQE